jgi:rpsU-divergently transcribed protein|tara:strand:- start:175 stop:795 length:621 start_codon:yes stop_codon:yes gene_type:complete
MYKKEFKHKLMIEILNQFSSNKDLKQVFKEALNTLNIEQKNHNRIITYHFPNHFNDVMSSFNELISIKLKESIPKKFVQMRVSEKIKYCIISRLKILNEYNIDYNYLFKFMLKPSNLIFSKKLLFKISDDIWSFSGDKSLDFNYYSKRLILMKIYFLSFRFWINDHSKKKEQTDGFVNDQLKITSKIGKYKFLFKESLNNLRGKFF